MQERGFTQRALAKELKVSEDTVAHWLWARYYPQRANFEKLCRVLDVSPNMLVQSSSELIERGRTTRIVRFHAKEVLGQNDAPEYREVREIEVDLALESERVSDEEEVKEEDFTISGESESPEDTKSDTA